MQRLVVLLSRPELDLPTLNLPPAEDSELPSLIAREVEQQLGETEEPPIIDFHVVAHSKADKNVGRQVLVFALPAKEFRILQKQVVSAGFKLVAICSRHLAPLGILQRQSISNETLAVTVHHYTGEVELAVCRGAEPILLRTIRLGTDEPARVAEQIIMELQRCLTLLPIEVAELQLGWYVFATSDAARQVATAIEDRGESTIHTIDPLVDWEVNFARKTKSDESDNDAAESESRVMSAANGGAAWDFVNNSLPVNLLAPKQAPKPKNPMVRWAAIGGCAAFVLCVGLYFLLFDVWQLQIVVDTLQKELDNAKKLTAKYQEKSDQVQAVQGWLADQVDWLSELNELSSRLPDGPDATVRRLTASATANSATIDISVQVADQEFISQLESRIRSAKYGTTSKQISQNLNSAEYPWQFETRVSFPIEVQKQNAYGPKEGTKPTPQPSARETATQDRNEGVEVHSDENKT
ncbi:MAG TPA: hypothetical protein VM260_04210, partial [Pirellula sp.]|nr:hypothetical protein [Pirellula sp.]